MRHRKPTPAWQKLGLKISKKVVVGITAAATAFGGLAIASTSAQASTGRDSYADTVQNATFEQARKKYGLAKEMSEGATLHAWEWSFKTIEENIPKIAEAGYTSVQTEPISAIHTGNKGKIFTENWYYVYQPTDTTIGNWVMGTEDDLKSLCETAHKYGVRIIVDVVANHMTATWGAIADRWKKSDLYHHDCNDGDVQDYNNRYQVTHCKLLGLYDINTSKTEAANMMHDYLVQAVNDGVDGFRFDAAKHIELPDEYDGSQYWNIVLNNGAQFQYGEVLQDSISRDADYAKLFANNSRHGGGVTASYYGIKLRGALSSKNLNAGNLNNWDNAAGGNNLVSWVESHDNYSNKPNDYGASMKMSEWEMTMGWGVIGSRSQTMPLYFDRPVGSGGSQPQFSEQSKLGDAGAPSWYDPQVVAVNHFRNAMNNNKAAEYMRNCKDNNACLMVERYIKDGNSKNDGVTITNMNAAQDLSGIETTLDDGTYTDQVSGGKLVVSGGKIQSGTAPAGKISVFFTDNSASVSASGAKSFKTDTTTITLNANNATDTTYTTSEGKSGSYKDGDTITVGASTAVGGTVTVKVQGKDADGQTVSGEFTCTKRDPNATSTAYAKKPNNWSNLYAYVYVDDPDASTLQQNAKWPGVAMTKVSAGDNCGQDGEYKYEIPDELVNDNTRIIFNDGNAENTLKYPADTTEGVDAAGLKIDGNYAWNGNTTSGTWEARNCVVTPTKSVKIDQSDYSVDLSNGVATKQLTATTDPKGASVSWSSSDKDVATVSPKGVVTPRKAGTATITAKSGTKTSSITVTVTGQLPPDPVAKNTIYASKPSGWGKIYAYVYTGDGATAVNNAAWPGVEMAAPSATDGCGKTGLYKYVVPDNLASGAKVIFNDGGSQQYPGSRQPGLDYNGGIVQWDGSSAALGAVECETTIPVTSVSISGDGVKDGKLSLKSGASVQLTATVNPSNATDRKVTWTSSDSSVANVMGTGVVTAGSKAGTATIKATAGGKSASVTVTVSGPQDPYAQVDALAKAHASDLADGEYVVSTALKDGLVLDVAGGSKSDKANVQVWSSNGSTSQRWVVSHDSKGYVTLKAVRSGKVLDVAGGSKKPGANAQQYASNGSRSQKWVAVRDGSSYRLVSALADGLDLDVAGASRKDGANVQVWSSNGSTSQRWAFSDARYAQVDALAKAHASDLADGEYVVSTALKDGLVLDVAGGSKSDKANVQVWSSNGSTSQRWVVSHDSKGYVTLKAVRSGKVLDVAGGSKKPGANAQQYASNGSRSQKWVAVRDGSSYRLVSALADGLDLDVAGASRKDGANVQVWSSNGSTSQRWAFRSAEPLTVWYKPSSVQSRVRLQWRVYGTPDSTGGMEMTKACGGWWKASVPSAGSVKTGLSFSYGSVTDDNGGKLYDVKGESAAVSGGQAITDITPNCVATTKQ
ncbi:MAG: RICIN domain-containing protein [Bifidobacterium adolescentis]